ncbi:MAG: hypothetical protein J6Y15_04020 [Bacteroidaceae bacterium]|nr:hypothetical protein [Bacteroidaceae bacterium]
MKRIIFLLLLACSTFSSGFAQWRRATRFVAQKPDNVIKILENIINDSEEHKTTTFSVVKNPVTGVVESSVKVIHFKACMDNYMVEDLDNAFQKDEPKSYQLVHVVPGNTGNKKLINVPVCSDSGVEYIGIRTHQNQETWMMCTKNSSNPKLRDVYAISWKMNAKNKAEGDIIYITSLRPDNYDKKIETSSSTFMIDGRVGYDLNDSLYVVYMADSAEELDQIADSAFIAYMPVVNKRFSFSIELDKPKVGRIRTVMPDGSLCELWTNLDFVPGETYRITTHNGFYDADNDYEVRVGRYSGKSLLNRDQIKGIDDQKEIEVTRIEVDEQPTTNNNATYTPATSLVEDYKKFKESLPADQKAKLRMLEGRGDAYEKAYKALKHTNNVDKTEANVKIIVNEMIEQLDGLSGVVDDYCKLLEKNNAPVLFSVEIISRGYLKECVDLKSHLDKNYDQVAASKSLMRLHDYLTKQIKKNTDKVEKLLKKVKQQ